MSDGSMSHQGKDARQQIPGIENLDRQRRHYQALFALAPQPALVTDISGVIQEANREARELLHSPEGLWGIPLASLVAAVDHLLFARLLALLLDSPEIQDAELHLTPHGSLGSFPTHVRAIRFADPDGGQESIHWSITDIRPQKASEGAAEKKLGARIRARTEELEQALARLRDAEAGLRNLAKFPEENPNAVLRIALDGTILFANRGSRIILDDWGSTVGGPAPADWRARIREAAASGERLTIEVEIAGRWFSLMFVPILDEGYVNLYGRDITIRKDVEVEQERLAVENRVQKTLLESIFEADPGAIAVVVGVDLHFVFVNPAYRYTTPDPIKDPIGRKYDSVWPHRSKYSHRDRYREVIQTGNPFQATGVLHQFPDGCQRIFTVQARRIQWEDQPACLIIMWDVTELEGTRQQLADELQKRQAAEKAVEAEKERFLTSLTSIGDAVITTDQQGRITFMNPVAEQLTGWPSAEALDRPLEQVFPIVNERTLEPVENPVGKVLQLGLVIGLANHTALISRDGRSIPVEDSAAPIKNTAGETLGVVMVFHDVTEKRRSEETLRQLNRMIDLSDEPIFSWELDGGILTWNQGCEQLYGFMRSEAVGQISHELLNTRHPLPLEEFKAWLVRDGGWTGVLHQLTRDGREVIIETRHELMEIAGRRVVLETNRDITDRLRLDEQIHLQIAALEATANGVVITDRKGLIEWANPAFTALTGYSPEEAGGKNPSSLVRSGVHDSAFYQAMWGTILSGKVWRGEIVNRRKDGSLYNEEMTITPVADEQGQISHFIAIKQDISGRKKSEQEAQAHLVQIELQQRLLEQREQERLQVARDLHDGPVQELTAVSFELQGLLDSAGSAEEAEKIQKVKAAVLAQVAELRSYAGELRPPTLSKFGLAKAVRSHVDDLEEKHPEVAVRLAAQPGSDDLPESARLAFFRIYQQAVNNILKHASASEVQIRLSRTEMEKIDGTARFRFEMEIRDNGRGFDPPPDWVELARHGHFGLVGMRERAEAVGAHLELRSAPGSGTTVQVAIELKS